MCNNLSNFIRTCQRIDNNSLCNSATVYQWSLDAMERNSCTSRYWGPAFQHLKFHFFKCSGTHNHLFEGEGKSNLQFPNFNHWQCSPILTNFRIISRTVGLTGHRLSNPGQYCNRKLVSKWDRGMLPGNSNHRLNYVVKRYHPYILNLPVTFIISSANCPFGAS